MSWKDSIIAGVLVLGIVAVIVLHPRVKVNEQARIEIEGHDFIIRHASDCRKCKKEISYINGIYILDVSRENSSWEMEIAEEVNK